MKHLSLEQIFEYIDSNIQPAESKRIALHLQECPMCSKEVEQHRSLSIILEKSPVTDPSSVFSIELMDAIMREPIPAVKRNPSIISQIRASWLVAACLIITFGVFIASIPQRQILTPKPLGIQHFIHGYSDWMMIATHSVTDFFTAFSSFFPVKKVGSLLLLTCAGLLLWLVDVAARKRFLRAH